MFIGIILKAFCAFRYISIVSVAYTCAFYIDLIQFDIDFLIILCISAKILLPLSK
jgi:hypothetical protein